MNCTSMFTNTRIDGPVISGWNIKRCHVDFLGCWGVFFVHMAFFAATLRTQ